MIGELIAGGVLLVAAVSGWIAAYTAKGAANDEAARARLAESARDAQRARADDAESRTAIAMAQRKVSDQRSASLQSELDRERKERRELLESLAKMGAPVGPALVESALDRLYANQDRGEAGGGPGPVRGGDPLPVSGVPPGAPAAPARKP